MFRTARFRLTIKFFISIKNIGNHIIDTRDAAQLIKGELEELEYLIFKYHED